MTIRSLGGAMPDLSLMSHILDKNDAYNELSKSGSTPQWIITGKNIFYGSIDNEDDMISSGAPCSGPRTGGVRNVSINSSGELSGDGTTKLLTTSVCIKYGGWGPVLQDLMHRGKKIPTLTITRLTNIEQTLVPIQKLIYNTCYISSYIQEGDIITLTFCYVELQDTSITYDHDGQKLGQVAVIINAASVSSKLESS